MTPFPTIAPLVPTATAVASDVLLALVIRNANIRSGPGTDFEIIGIANEGSQVALRVARDDWYGITTADGLEGWMSEVVLEIDPQTAEAVPVDSP
jgi:uncharacterized protein YgiM (DUF1202 family)